MGASDSLVTMQLESVVVNLSLTQEARAHTSDLTGSFSALYQGPCSLHCRYVVAPELRDPDP